MDKKALLVAILITVLLVGYAFIPMGKREKSNYNIKLNPWSGSYTSIMELPYIDSGDLVEIYD